MEKKTTIGFIGAGNMAKAIFSGMLQKKACDAGSIIVSRRDKNALALLEKEYGIYGTTDNREVVNKADIVFLAVKPQKLKEVIMEIAPFIRKEQIFVSIAAGKTISFMEEGFGTEVKLIRAMPNTPAQAGEGCISFCANQNTDRKEIELVKQMFDCCGTSYEIEEGLMDVAGAVAGSAPAFLFMFMEAMADAAVLGGMPRELAYKMAAQTVKGSGKLMQETGEHPGSLKDMVCSPAGTTICGVKVLEERGMRGAVMGALDSCIQKSKKI